MLTLLNRLYLLVNILPWVYKWRKIREYVTFIFQNSNPKNSGCRLIEWMLPVTPAIPNIILYENTYWCHYLWKYWFHYSVKWWKMKKKFSNRSNKFLFSQRKKYDITGVHGPRPPRTDSYSVQVVGPQWICNFCEVVYDEFM